MRGFGFGMRRSACLCAVVLAAVALAGSVGVQARRPSKKKPPKVPEEVTEVKAAVASFLDALNACDLKKTIVLFAPGATAFTPMRERAARADGMGEIEAFFQELYDHVRRERPGPPYLDFAANDLKVQVEGRMAVATFQMRRGPGISRRTLVLVKMGERWLILHLHASNLRPDQPAYDPAE